MSNNIICLQKTGFDTAEIEPSKVSRCKLRCLDSVVRAREAQAAARAASDEAARRDDVDALEARCEGGTLTNADFPNKFSGAEDLVSFEFARKSVRKEAG